MLEFMISGYILGTDRLVGFYELVLLFADIYCTYVLSLFLKNGTYLNCLLQTIYYKKQYNYTA